MAEAHGVWGWGYLPIFLLLFWATWLTRGSFLLFGEKVRLPQSVQMWLRYAPAAALGALVAPDLFLAGGEVAFKPELVAAVVVMVSAAFWRNPWAPFALGMLTLVALQNAFPG